MGNTKIALVNHSLAPLGGREFHAVMLANGLQELGADVDVWALRIDPVFAEKNRVPYHKINIPGPGGVIRQLLFAQRATMLRLQDRYDRVISMSPMSGQHLHIAGGARNPDPNTSVKEILLRRHHDSAVANAPVVIASNKSAAEVLSQRLPRVKKVVPLYPPIDTRRFRLRSKVERAAARATFGFSNTETYMLFPSTGHMRKGLDIAVAAVAELASKNIRLVVAGKPVKALNVISLGFVEDMASLYAAVDCTLLPTRNDPFGLVIAESIRSGTPAISSIFAGASEIMSENDGIVIDDISTLAVRKAIEQFMARTWTQDAMSDLEFLSKENYATAVQRLYV